MSNELGPAFDGGVAYRREADQVLPPQAKTLAVEQSGLQRAARLAAEIVALKLAHVVDGSIPQLHNV